MTDDARASLLQSYRHYKGGTYTLLCLAENSEDRSETMAVYVSHLTRKVLVRPWGMFREAVEWADSVRRPRFVELDLAPEFPTEHSADFYQQFAMYHSLAEEAAEARVRELEARVIELEARVCELEARLVDSGLGLLVNLCNRVGP